MSFEIQELTDIIRIIVLLNLSKGLSLPKSELKRRIDKVCVDYACVEVHDVQKALDEMNTEGLIHLQGENVILTDEGARLGKEWRSLLLKKDPVIEIVAGLVDGSITGLVVVLSAFLATLSIAAITFAAVLTVASVSITNFSSFFLGGITEDLSDMITLQALMHYSLSDLPDVSEREKSLVLLKRLFTVLHDQISRSNLYAAIICGTTTFLAGIVPILAYLLLPKPANVVVALGMVGGVVGVFLVRYRARKGKVHWKVTLLETIVIVAIAALASLLIGRV